MEFIISNITFVVTTFTLLSHVLFVGVLLLAIFEKGFRKRLYDFVNTYVLQLLLVTVASAVVGSLVYSNIVGFPPCELCWIQRIFMYPQLVLVSMALWKKDKGIVSYLMPLSLIGGFIAMYHSLTHFGIGEGVVGCTSALGDCGKLYVFEYGYITIPLMSFTIFAYILAISFVYFKAQNAKE